MIKRKISTLSLAIVFVGGTFLTSCKKYDDGGRHSRADNIVVKHSWKISSATDLEDNTNITSDYYGEVWELTKDDEFLENSNKKGTYYFSVDKTKLIISKTNGGTDTYTIVKMKKDEMILNEKNEEELTLIEN